MDEYLKQALEIIKAQASVRTMTEEEISSMMRSIALSIKQIAEGAEAETVAPETEQDPTKVIKEKSITCLECGKAFMAQWKEWSDVTEKVYYSSMLK
ncbi:MucR family transcriptional regulator [Desulfovibrio subterraneus]|uniref:Uncharacterized protein n=1 Tax=Desulfovibrio subterraneus TaxID=2718620 RepID=A0A7J0BNC5_9BACT|nr:MucR family transcriptional regulator [Desulfovibrio subterraneus]GFM34771.1 hypothetical protein DSM101010T_31360 [Desulfovibrio subterraneus]